MAIVLHPHITADPEVLGGAPVIEGTRILVSAVITRVAGGWSFDRVAAYYGVTEEDVRDALMYASLVTGKPASEAVPTSAEPYVHDPLTTDEKKLAEEEACRLGLDTSNISSLGWQLLAIRAKGFASGDIQPITWEELQAEMDEQRHRHYYDDER